MKFNSLKFKISVLYTAILGIILIVYSSILYFSLYYTLYNDLDGELMKKANQISYAINDYSDALGSEPQSLAYAAKAVISLKEESRFTQRRIKELERKWLKVADKLDLSKDYIGFFSSKGEAIARSSNLSEELFSLFPKDIKSSQDKQCFRNTKFNKRNLRLITAPFSYKEGKSYIIQVATSIKPIVYILQNRVGVIALSIPPLLLLTSFIGRLLAVRILRPVEEIAKTAKRITHEDLSARVEPKRIDKEMKYLVDAFNDMISRLEKSFRYIAEFSSHVAHELKTPLAIIRGESEVALRKQRTPEEYQRVIKINLEEIQRLIRVIEDLLLLARLDYRPELIKLEKIDLTGFIKDIYEQSRILASEKDIAVSVNLPEQPVHINANPLHLRRLFFNLIHNAIKFNFPDGKIDINVRPEGESVSVSMKDTGAGIKDTDLPKIFDKFFRIDREDQGAEPGSGLGLTIAQSIAKIHHGRIEVESRPGEGSIFTVFFPLL